MRHPLTPWPGFVRRRPEQLPRAAHPAQGALHRVRDRIARLRGGGLPVVFSQAAGQARISRVLQWVTDFSPRPLDDLRIADLGCGEGEFSIELARRGVEVVAIEGRREHIETGLRRREQLGLWRLSFLHEDVRTFSPEPGEFDVILCLGLLYHLQAQDIFAVTTAVASGCRHFAIFETQVSLSARRRVNLDGHDYWGRDYREDVRQPGASIDNRHSFWPTKPSLLNLLSSAGFSSVAELLNPAAPPLEAYTDHVALLAAKSGPGRQASDARGA